MKLTDLQLLLIVIGCFAACLIFGVVSFLPARTADLDDEDHE